MCLIARGHRRPFGVLSIDERAWRDETFRSVQNTSPDTLNGIVLTARNVDWEATKFSEILQFPAPARIDCANRSFRFLHDACKSFLSTAAPTLCLNGINYVNFCGSGLRVHRIALLRKAFLRMLPVGYSNIGTWRFFAGPIWVARQTNSLCKI